MRDYSTMRHVLAVAAQTRSEMHYTDFQLAAGQDDGVLEGELDRLTRDGLLDADVEFGGGFGVCKRCSVRGLTDEGREFYKLVENKKVWGIILETLKEADIDISYPLLKEVCEEIVKRYVTSCIPEIPRSK